ncbi:MAG: hypothetical protein SCALA702_05620 [Melioribacteraceae bacterium]|nr:MAG: hypothetical protein SCALA702_05620 [Melioribacteraceae bacterium]
MYSTAKELRFHTKALLDSVKRGEEVIITYRGKPAAKLVPVDENVKVENESSDLFGIWADKEEVSDVENYIRRIRKGRFS